MPTEPRHLVRVIRVVRANAHAERVWYCRDCDTCFATSVITRKDPKSDWPRCPTILNMRKTLYPDKDYDQ